MHADRPVIAFAWLVVVLVLVMAVLQARGPEGAWGDRPGVPVGNVAGGDGYAGMTGECTNGIRIAAAPVKVTVSPQRALGPHDIRVTATIEPHPDNRVLVIVLDGPRYERQDIELNATPNDEQRTFERRFAQWPSGRYDVSAYLVRVGQTFRASTSLCLIGMFEDCQ